QQDDQPACRREGKTALEGGGQRRIRCREEQRGNEQTEVGGNAEHGTGVRARPTAGIDPVDREDATHRHEAEAEEENPILGDLHGGNREERREPEGQQRDHRDDEEVLPRHDDAGVGGGMRQEPGEGAGGEEEGAERRRRRGQYDPGARSDRGGGHSKVTAGPPKADGQYHLVVVETGAQAALQQTGVRLTPQRLAIAAVLAQTGKGTSAQELYERVRKKYAYIGRATVFRSL